MYIYLHKRGICGTRLTNQASASYIYISIDKDSLAEISGNLTKEFSIYDILNNNHIQTIEIKYKGRKKMEQIEVPWKQAKKASSINKLQTIYYDKQPNLIIEVG